MLCTFFATPTLCFKNKDNGGVFPESCDHIGSHGFIAQRGAREHLLGGDLLTVVLVTLLADDGHIFTVKNVFHGANDLLKDYTLGP